MTTPDALLLSLSTSVYNASILSTTPEPEEEKPTAPPEQVAEWILMKIFMGPILIIGIIGNILSIMVFSQKELRDSVTSFLFRALAVCDLVSLVKTSEPVFVIMGVDVVAANDGACKAFTYIYRVARGSASWVLVLISAERFVGVYFPFKVKNVSTKRNAIIALCIIVVSFVALYLPVLWLYEDEAWYTPPLGRYVKDCGFSKKLPAYKEAFPMLENTFYTFIPFALLLVMNISIARWLTLRQKGQTGASGSGQQSGDANNMTKMLMVTAFAFLFLTAPYSIYFIIREIYDLWALGIFWKVRLFRAVAFIMYSMNHAFNFFFYVFFFHF